VYGCSTLYGVLLSHEGLLFCTTHSTNRRADVSSACVHAVADSRMASRAIVHILDRMAPSYKLGTGATVEPVRHTWPAGRALELVAHAMGDRITTTRASPPPENAEARRVADRSGARRWCGRALTFAGRVGRLRRGRERRLEATRAASPPLYNRPDGGGGGLTATCHRTPQPASTGGGRPPRVARATRPSATWPSQCESLPPAELACGRRGACASSCCPHPLWLAVSRPSFWAPTRVAVSAAKA